MKYDLILVLGYFRSAGPFLSVVKHLSKHLRVGLLPAVVDQAFLTNTGRSQAIFLELCRKFGADIVAQGTPVQAGLMIVQQFLYPAETVEIIMATVKSDKRAGLMGLAMAGLENHDVFLSQFDIDRIYVASKRFFNFLVEHRQAWERYQGVEVVETGLPYSKYPVFPEFEADYLIAAPTMFSFNTEKSKHAFLRNVLKLLAQIPTGDKVVYKPHNGAEKDYFTPRWHYFVAQMLLQTPGGCQLLTWLIDMMPSSVNRHLERIQTGILHLQIFNRAIHIAEITSYADMSLEAFLPGIRKGVIGGLSNTIWGTLYFNLPYYNCIDPAARTGESELIRRKSDNLLDLNLQYFGIPYCEGELSAGDRGENIISDADRESNLISSIYHDLSMAQCAT